jgi:hypothetical protein
VSSLLLSPHEVADCVLGAGFRANDGTAQIMLAVVMVESAASANKGIRLDVMARSSAGDHVGNWDHGIGQISGKFHAALIRKYGGQWRDPYVNLRMCREIFLARKVSHGDGFTAWAGYTGGGYRPYLLDAQLAIATPWPCPTLDWMPRV